ncbi:MAG: hypothetical protein CM15mV38_0870 [uncultured marine virus]|nr:MAG: hypothetical protein CM15mV38_0870 [uncultured marine virus]
MLEPSIKRLYKYIRKHGTRKQNLELDWHYDAIHAIVEDIMESKGTPLPQQKRRPKQ